MHRLWRNTIVVNGCWEWQGHTVRGYGRIRVGSRKDGSRRMVATHRLAWELTNGPIPDGLCVLHKCDNRSCIKPGHLFLGTNDDNVQDKIEKRRQSRLAGESNPSAVLDESEAKQIIRRLLGGANPTEMAKSLPVGRELLYAMRAGRVWRPQYFQVLSEIAQREENHE